jgi:2-desacetyl-2-hydroxyethyl bacteriochlorophyllide A dehydrogenase
MRALLVERPGSMRLVDMPEPEPAPDEALVAIDAAGICGSDLEVFDGTRPAEYVRYPIVPGHEWAGTVVRLGAGVEHPEPGTRVVGRGFRSCGRCVNCQRGQPNLCAELYAEVGFTEPGAFAEQLRLQAGRLYAVPGSSDPNAAALLEPAACVATGLLEAPTLRPGLEVAVIGAGTLGLIAVSILAFASPARLMLIGTRSHRLTLARELGATEVIDAGELDRHRAGTFDLVFEATNSPEAADLAFELARRGGTVVLEGITGRLGPSIGRDEITLRHLRVQGIFGSSPSGWLWVVDLFSRGQLRLDRLVSHRLPLDDFAEAFDLVRLKRDGAVKVQLEPRTRPM